MKKIVYLFVVAGCLLQADSTNYTRIAWTKVPTSALKTDDFYNPNQVQKEQEAEIVEEVETPFMTEDASLLQTVTVIDESKEEMVKLDTPTWIFVD